MKQDEIMMLTGKVSVCMSGPEKTLKNNDGVYIVRYISENCEGETK